MNNKADEKLNTAEVDYLFESLLEIRNKDEMRKYLRDLLTVKEIETFAMRLKSAQMLDNNVPYLEIERKTGLSSATIARVSEYLKYGYDGYKLILDRLSKKKK